MKPYDYLIVGSGLFGAVFAHEAHEAGKRCLVIEKRHHIGGNIYCEEINGINVHKYGAHIFHTDNKKVWQYVNQLVEFNRYTNSPIANYKGKLYNLPFNMNTFSKMWNIKTPAEAKQKIAEQIADLAIENPSNLEEQALSLVGRDVYEKLIKGYTEKQWGRDCKDLPAFIIKRLPLRFVYDNNYFNDPYQGIPKGGYTAIVEKTFIKIPVDCVTTSLDQRSVIKRVDGNDSVVKLDVESSDENFVYVRQDFDQLKLGDVILKGTGETATEYTISEVSTKTGVLTANGAFAQFASISVLGKNGEYTIADANKSGLKAYDKIITNAADAAEGDEIY